MRNLPHSHAVSRHATFPPNGNRRAVVASQLGPLRHGARRLSSKTDEPGRIVARLRLALPQALFPHFNLAASSAGMGRGANVPGRLVSFQTFESALDTPQQTPP